MRGGLSEYRTASLEFGLVHPRLGVVRDLECVKEELRAHASSACRLKIQLQFEFLTHYAAGSNDTQDQASGEVPDLSWIAQRESLPVCCAP
jgi:hypothetical protein